MAKLMVGKIKPPLGQITDITLVIGGAPVGAASISRKAVNGAYVADLVALDASGTTTFSITSPGNPNFRISGSQLLTNVDPDTLVPGAVESINIKAVDSRGSLKAFTKTLTVNIVGVPTGISLFGVSGAANQSSTIVESDPAGTQIGSFQVNGNGVAPYGFAVTLNAKGAIGLDSQGRKSLVSSPTATWAVGVNETIKVAVTDANNEVYEETFTISVTAAAVVGTSRFSRPAPLAKIIYVVWNKAGRDPTQPVNAADLVSGWCNEAVGAGCWRAYSYAADGYPDIDGSTGLGTPFDYVDAIVDWCDLNNHYPVAFKGGTPGNIKNYIGPWAAQLRGPNRGGTGALNQSNTGNPTQIIGWIGNGLTDKGVGPTGVKLRGVPNTQIYTGKGGSQNTTLFNLKNDGHNGQNECYIHQVRCGPFREMEALNTISAFNSPGARSEADCIFRALTTSAFGLAFMQNAKRVTVTECEVVGSLGHGLNSSTQHDAASSYQGMLQVFDSYFGRNGSGDPGQSHNTYNGRWRHLVFGYNYMSNSYGHHIKMDNNQRGDAYENTLVGLDEDNTYLRTSNPKAFNGTVNNVANDIYESAMRQIPASGSPVVRIFGFYDQINAPMATAKISDGTGGAAGTVLNITSFAYGNGLVAVGQSVTAAAGVTPGTVITAFLSGTGGQGTYQVNIAQLWQNKRITLAGSIPFVGFFTDAGGTTNLGDITVITSGTPGVNEALLTVIGAQTLDPDTNKATASFTFHASRAGQFVRIPGRGFAVNKAISGQACINIDNENQDLGCWNNMFLPLHTSVTVVAPMNLQGRHQGGDGLAHKLPSFSYNGANVLRNRKFQSVSSVVINDPLGSNDGDITPPQHYCGWVSSVLAPLTYRISYPDYPYAELTAQSPGLDRTQFHVTDQFDVEIRCNGGQILPTTATIIAVAAKTLDILVAADPSTVGGIITALNVTPNVRANAIAFKRFGLQWDGPLLIVDNVIGNGSRDWCDRTSPNYYFYEVSVIENGKRVLDLTKTEPGAAGNKYGIPCIHFFDNLTICQDFAAPNQPAYDPTNVPTYVNGRLMFDINLTFSTSNSFIGNNNDVRPPYPPLQPSDRASLTPSWPVDPQAGIWDWRPHAGKVGGTLWATGDGQGGLGFYGSDMFRPNYRLVHDCFLFDFHVPAGQKYEAWASPGNAGQVNEDLYQTNLMAADMRTFRLSTDVATPLDVNGTIKIDLIYKDQFPPYVDRGSPFVAIGPYNATPGPLCISVGDAFLDRFRMKSLTAAVPLVGDKIQVECDGQWGRWKPCVHNALLTSVISRGAGVYDVIFSPPLPKTGDLDTVGQVVTPEHQKGLSACVDQVRATTVGGRGAFGKPSVVGQAVPVKPSWFRLPVQIPDFGW